MVRVRIAPSPTGLFHMGTARAALFNWLFARHHGGKFLVRIEDTDLERSKPEFEQDILEGLRWLGLDWDEGPGKEVLGPSHQRDRIPLYSKALKTLMDQGQAYHCYCTAEELESAKRAADAAHQSYRYDGRCRNTPPQDRDRSVIRFRIPDTALTIQWVDLVRGPVEFDRKELDDVIIAKSMEEPLYNFAVVVDDAAMNITHVIRGEDHISNTPKQLLIAQALGLPAPQFGHIPLILNADRTKMSKRLNNVAVSWYRSQGYLPEAMVNFLAFLGWNPGGEQEIFDSAELCKLFDLDRVQKSGAIFNEQKLRWFNHAYLNQKTPEQYKQLLTPYLPEIAKPVDLDIAIAVIRPRIEVLSEATEALQQLFGQQLLEYEASLLVWPKLVKTVPDAREQVHRTKKALEQTFAFIRTIEPWQQQALEPTIKDWITRQSMGVGETLWPLRVALSGSQNSPTPFELLAACGKELSLQRIEYAVQKLSKAV